MGISLDGDADRLIMADADGNIYNGDQLLYVMVNDRLATQSVLGVVGTLMTNYALEQRFNAMDIPFVRAKVGDRYVLEALKERGWIFGGESSGHLIVLDKQTTGDGIVSALQVLSAMKKSGQSLAQLTKDLVMMPQVLKNVRLNGEKSWENAKLFKKEVEAAQKEIVGKGRILIRPSGTEPLLRIMVEHVDNNIANNIAEKLSSTLIDEMM